MVLPAEISENNFPLLTDSFGREIFYLRIAVTDRCNLRCTYCMPAEGVPMKSHDSILSFEELLRLTRNFAELGIRKVRVTGGEPFVRKGVTEFIDEITRLRGIDSVYLTTNGVLLSANLARLIDAGISGINFSLDTLRKDRFLKLTLRDRFEDVRTSLSLLADSGLKIKINTVVQKDFNEDEIGEIAALAANNNFDVRFIEKMPFNGGHFDTQNHFGKKDILLKLRDSFPGLAKINLQRSNAELYTIPGFKGRIGVIDGYTRSFCGSCNRVRITPEGILKTCLYDGGVFDFRKFLREGVSDSEIKNVIRTKISEKFRNGFEAEKAFENGTNLPMAKIGG